MAAPDTTLLVASSGGHLAQLHRLHTRLPDVGEHRTWVTFDTEQSRSLLAGEDVRFVEHITARDIRRALAAVPPASRLVRRDRIALVVSTGAAVALPFLAMASARRVPAMYIESATRTAGPSLTARLLRPLPGIEFYTQSESWATRTWHYGGSVFDNYELERIEAQPLHRVVVTLGGHEAFGFRRLVERLIAILPGGAEVLWQTGSTDVQDLPIAARAALPAAELRAAMSAADVVVGHAGVGTVLDALDQGKRPVIVPRDPAHGEHVDGHQLDLAADLARRGIVHATSIERLSLADLEESAGYRVTRSAAPPPFVSNKRPDPAVRRRFRR